MGNVPQCLPQLEVPPAAAKTLANNVRPKSTVAQYPNIAIFMDFKIDQHYGILWYCGRVLLSSGRAYSKSQLDANGLFQIGNHSERTVRYDTRRTQNLLQYKGDELLA